ncbi:hypothetical protein DEFR109230_10125 [Deinococcus frigens]
MVIAVTVQGTDFSERAYFDLEGQALPGMANVRAVPEPVCHLLDLFTT